MSNSPVQMPTPEEALMKLIAGNKRFISSTQMHPHQTATHRAELGSGQHPFAVILGCADSRVPPEIIFDQGLGDLFTVRVAGNGVNEVILGSIEYAAAHLHTPLVVVLGHSKCGAVAATLAGGKLEGHLPSLAKAIQPAVEQVKGQVGDTLDNAVRANAKMVAAQLATAEPILAELVGAGKLNIIAAYYDLDSGQVDILS